MIDRDLQSIQDVRTLVTAARRAADELRLFTQEQIDRIVEAMAQAGTRHAEALAKLAVEETGMGRVESKIEKNLFATVHIYEAMKNMKTCGLVRKDPEKGIIEFAEPFGVVAGIIPTTNPTSTALFKILIAIKTRNAIVLSPHPRAIRCIAESAQILYEAGLRMGLPKGAIGCMTLCTLEATNTLMTHRYTSLILATGGSALVKAAYSSGKPAIGVGPGNAPVYVDRSAIVSNAATGIFTSETFDWGTICATEQSIVIHQDVKAALIDEFKKKKAYFLTPDQIRAVEKYAIKDNLMNPDLVGQSPQRIAELCHIQVPADATVLMAEYEGIGKQYPLSLEILAPLLTLYTAKDWQEGLKMSEAILDLGGRGHTFGIYAEDENIIMEFARILPAYRILVNSPTAQGAIGLATNLFPSMTLGCGTYGNNITSDNVGPLNLLNWKKVAWITEAWKQKLHYVSGSKTSSGVADRVALSATGSTPSVSISKQEVQRMIQSTMQEPSAPKEGGSDFGLKMNKQDISQLIQKKLGGSQTSSCPMAFRCMETTCPNNK
ncbi:MAG: aldehyde dehydrogenase family protein [Planctomycetota bacterium]